MLVLRLVSRIDLGYNEDGNKHWGYLEMTDEQLEMVADTINFDIQPRIATKEDVVNQRDLPYEHPTDFYEVEIVKNPEETLEFITEPITFKTVGGYVEDAEENREYKKIQRYIDSKHQNGRLNGNGGLSARSLKLHKNIINQTLNLAVQNKLIPSNPCQFVVLPQCVRYESKYYNDRQLRELFTALSDDPLLPLVKITALYGLRRSELLGLQWDSIDFERKSMTIRHTVSKVTEVVAKDKPKNASSRRTFPLTSEAVDIFLTAKRQEQRNRTAFGNEYQDNNYVFKWPDGHTYSPDYVSHRFNDLLKKHSLPHIRFHELRHSCASMLIAMGWSLKDVQEWLGHSDVKMTANIYAHLDTTRKNNIAESLAEKFGA